MTKMINLQLKGKKFLLYLVFLHYFSKSLVISYGLNLKV